MGKPSGSAVAWLVVGSIAVLGPELWAIGTLSERWPWTCAPMFAASPVSLDRAVIRVTTVKQDGARAPLNARTLGIPDWYFGRLLFLDVWRPGDGGGPAARGARVERFFSGLMRHPRGAQALRGVVAVDIEVQRERDGGALDPAQRLGTFDARAERFAFASGGAP